MLAKAIGKQLTCVFVDHGLFAKNEREEVCAVFGEGGLFDINFVCVDARERFYGKLKAFLSLKENVKSLVKNSSVYLKKKLKKSVLLTIWLQGTIYPDVVESGLGGESATIEPS